MRESDLSKALALYASLLYADDVSVDDLDLLDHLRAHPQVRAEYERRMAALTVKGEKQ